MKSVPFTAEFAKPAHCIETKCKLSEAFDAEMDPNGEHPRFMECNAIWDTGAMRTTISCELASRLGLIPLGQTRVLHTDGESICNYYVVNLLLPNKIEVKMLIVNDGKMKDTDMLIGMDIISMCDFAITGASAQKLKFSFQTPGVFDIDFCKLPQ